MILPHQMLPIHHTRKCLCTIRHSSAKAFNSQSIINKQTNIQKSNRNQTINMTNLSTILRRMSARSSKSKSDLMAKHAQSDSAAQPPVAPVCKIEGRDVVFGHVPGENRGPNPMNPPKVTFDPYFWLRDDTRTSPEVIAHLDAENTYTEQMTADLKVSEQAIYNDLLSHIQETDAKVPYLSHGYWYYSRTVAGQSYPVHCRRVAKSGGAYIVNVDDEGDEEVLLDLNKEANGKSHCALGNLVISPDNNLMMYTLDFNGNETFDLFFRDLSTGEQVLHNHTATVCRDGVQFGKTNDVVFLVTFDNVQRPDQVWCRVLNNDGVENNGTDDVCLYTETNPTASTSISLSANNQFLIVGSWSRETRGCALLDLNVPAESQTLKFVKPLEFGCKYSVDVLGDTMVILTNLDGAKNYKLMRGDVSNPNFENWTDVFPYDPETSLSEMHCVKEHLVLGGRSAGLTRLWVLDADLKERTTLEFDEELFVTRIEEDVNTEYDTDHVRITYQSLITPLTVIDVDLNTLERRVLKKEAVPNYDPALYHCTRKWATARDGKQIPMSMVYRKDTFNGKSPNAVLLRSYGSYGIAEEPVFRSENITLMDQGVVFVLAHIRGGGEFGPALYEDEGKYLTKKNTFNDYVDCASHLVDIGFTVPEKLAGFGRSAGGLLMGNVINMRPDLFKCIVAQVAFVDMMNTMCDPSIPLTTFEWEEWGNPNEAKYYQYMLEYSPYDQITRQDHPSVMITGGFHDPRVAYWEPAKFVARLRARNMGASPILLKIDMASGHFSASDKYKNMKETACWLSFLLHELGLGATLSL